MSALLRWLRRMALGLLLLAAALTLVTVRAILDGEGELRRSDVAFNEGDVQSATLHARQAAVAYAPGAPHVERAYARLEALARGSEAAGDLQGALYAWRAMRGAALETRHLFAVRSAELGLANASIARLQSLGGEPKSEGLQKEEMARLLQGLNGPHAPGSGRALMLAVGLLLVCIGLGVFLRHGLTKDGALQMRGAVLAAGTLVAGIVCWAVAALPA